MLIIIELGTTGLLERLKTPRVHKIGTRGVADTVAKFVGLTGLTDFISVEGPPPGRGLDEDRQVNLRVRQHLEQLVARGDHLLQAILLISPRKNFAQ